MLRGVIAGLIWLMAIGSAGALPPDHAPGAELAKAFRAGGPVAGSGRGTLVLEGGGRGAEGFERLVIEGAGPRPRLCLIATAMNGDGGEFARFGRPAGVTLVPLDIAEGNASDGATLDRLRGCTGFYFSGGDPRRLSEVFLPQGRPSPALAVIREAYQRRGAVVSGSSAGAMIVGRITLCECGADSSVQALLHDRQFEAPGFGLVEGVLIDAHFFARGLLGRHVWQLARGGFPAGVGIDEETAVVVPGDGGSWQVIGRRGVALIRAPAQARPGDLRGFTISLLAPGDRFDPASGAVQVAAGRRPIRSGRPDATASPLVDRSIFAPDRVRAVIRGMIEGGAEGAVGTAEDGRITVSFRRTGQTRGYADGTHTTALALGLGIAVAK